MKLSPEQTAKVSAFLNRCENLPSDIVEIAEVLKTEVEQAVLDARAFAEAEAERIASMTDGEVIAEASNVLNDMPSEPAAPVLDAVSEDVAPSAVLPDVVAPAEPTAEVSSELAPETAATSDSLGEGA